MAHACMICGGTSGRLRASDAHALCVALRDLNLPTPCLGHFCEPCNGSGHVGSAKAGPMLSLDLGPAAIRRSIEAVFPPCQTCKGKGYTPCDPKRHAS